MKTTLILLGVLVIAVASFAQPLEAPKHYWQQPAPWFKFNSTTRKFYDPNGEIRDFIPDDPWRTFLGWTNNVKTNGVEFCGKVMDVTKDGIRVEGEFGELFQTSYNPDDFEYHDFFVANYPFTTINDEIISGSKHKMAYRAGTYTYSTVNGGSRTILKLDYGIPCDAPIPTSEQIAADKAKKQFDKQKAAEKIFLVQSNAVRWLQSEATNGSVSAQGSLGEHYLNGLGCETNREQGIYWLNQAANQGDMEASNRLSKLKSP
ncbi:MAG TPA: hypothetical protein VFC85_05815 [Verrucomicrobiae bacterium]|nr:hypothetical protein [Verrucomicrobiae bacterium]